MSKYNKKIGSGKLGINLIKSFVDENECYFHEILQENDVGIDAFIEFTKDGENDGRCIAVQIKNGNSYFNATKSNCNIPINNHQEYWENHSLDVYGIVCDYDNKIAYWISISDYLKKHKKSINDHKINNISFPIMQINKLNRETFSSIFKRLVYGDLPQLNFEETYKLSHSSYLCEKKIALDLFMYKYVDKFETWNRFFEMFNYEKEISLLSIMVGFMSYVSGNPDLFGDLSYSIETKEYAKEYIKNFNKQSIIKMLKIVSECDFSRGSIGQCVERVINIIPNNKNILLDIIKNCKIQECRNNAFIILCYYDLNLAFKERNYIENELGKFAKNIFRNIEQFGEFELYI